MKKDTMFALRISTADYDRIQNKAQLSGMTMTDFLTLSALGKEIIVVEGLDAVTIQLKAIGKNLNQLTMLCNMGRITCPDLTQTKRSFGSVFDSICGLMDKGA